jgi:hypothetical protein
MTGPRLYLLGEAEVGSRAVQHGYRRRRVLQGVGARSSARDPGRITYIRARARIPHFARDAPRSPATRPVLIRARMNRRNRESSRARSSPVYFGPRSAKRTARCAVGVGSVTRSASARDSARIDPGGPDRLSQTPGSRRAREQRQPSRREAWLARQVERGTLDGALHPARTIRIPVPMVERMNRVARAKRCHHPTGAGSPPWSLPRSRVSRPRTNKTSPGSGVSFSRSRMKSRARSPSPHRRRTSPGAPEGAASSRGRLERRG